MTTDTSTWWDGAAAMALITSLVLALFTTFGWLGDTAQYLATAYGVLGLASVVKAPEGEVMVIENVVLRVVTLLLTFAGLLFYLTAPWSVYAYGVTVWTGIVFLTAGFVVFSQVARPADATPVAD